MSHSVRISRWSALLALGLACGCEGAHFRDVQMARDPESCLRYLRRHPEGAHAQAVRRMLDDARYAQAEAGGRPIGYGRYLAYHPQGRRARSARQELARLALARAKTSAELELILERHANTPEAKSAAKRLVPMLADEAIVSRDPATMQAFVDRYPQSLPWSERVRDELARVHYQNLVDDQEQLEAFAHDFDGTRWAAMALKRTARLLAQEVLETGDPALLESFAARFPEHERLEVLQARVQQRRRWEALVRLDPDMLRDTGEAALIRVARWCEAGMRRCERMRARARAASPWGPEQPLDLLAKAIYAVDPVQAWRAIEALSWVSDGRAGRRLLALIGSARIVDVWAAERAFERWLQRRRRERRQRWLARVLEGRKPHVSDDARQRRGYTLLRAGHHDAGERQLRSLLQRPERELSAHYLLTRGGIDAAEQTLSAVSRRLSALEQSLPAELHDEGETVALLKERELYVLQQVIAVMATQPTPPTNLGGVADRIQRVLSSWRLRLARAYSEFRPAAFSDLDQIVAKHERARAAALKRLLADRSWVARSVARSVCDLSRDRGDAKGVGADAEIARRCGARFPTTKKQTQK